METFLKTWLLDPTVGKLVAAGAGILIIVVLVRFFQRSLARYVKEPDTRYRVRKFIGIIGYLLGILLLGAIFSDRLGKLTVAFGVAGAGIAFALQEVITSIAGWVAVTLGHFYRTGDRIQLGGIRGDVIDIGLLRSTLMECGDWVRGDLYNGRIVRVANSFVFKEPVFNYSADFPFLWDEIVVPVRHGSDPILTRNILGGILEEVVGEYARHAKTAWDQVVKKYMIEPAKVEPMISLTADENWMQFTLRYVVDYKERRAKGDRIFSRILEEFEKTDGHVSVASSSMDIGIVKTPTIDLNVGRT